MAQQQSMHGKEQKNWIRTWGIVLATGIAGGVLMGIALSLIGWLFIFLVYATRDSQQEATEFLLMVMSYIVMTALGGMFVAKKTGQGAKSGAFCGLLTSLIATLLMILSIAAPDLFPALRMYVDPYASRGASVAAWDRSIWLVVALVALPVSLVSGPVLGAFGARMWSQKHPISGPVDQ